MHFDDAGLGTLNEDAFAAFYCDGFDAFYDDRFVVFYGDGFGAFYNGLSSSSHVSSLSHGLSL